MELNPSVKRAWLSIKVPNRGSGIKGLIVNSVGTFQSLLNCRGLNRDGLFSMKYYRFNIQVYIRAVRCHFAK